MQARRTSRATARAIAGYLDEEEEEEAEEELEALSGEVVGEEGARGEEVEGEEREEGEQAVAGSEDDLDVTRSWNLANRRDMLRQSCAPV